VTVEVPSDSSRTRRIALAVLAGVLGTALLGIGVWAVMRPPDPGVTQTEIEPAEQTTEPTAPPLPGTKPGGETPGGETPGGETAPGGQPPAAEAPDATAPEVAPVGAPRVAFALGGRIHVAEEDGSGAVAVAPQAGAYALSPDGATLAMVSVQPFEGAEQPGTLVLFDTATGAMRSVGVGAVATPPSWAPDSGWLAFTTQADTFRVDRVDTAGGAPTLLAAPGASPRVSRDGAFVAYAKTDQPEVGDPLHVVSARGGTPVSVGGGSGALSWDWGPSGTLYFTRPGDAEGVWELWVASAPGFKGKRVGSVALEAPTFALDDAVVSPDGSRVLLSATGDDGYSRLWVVDTKAGRFSAVSTRRDAYPYRWSADGRVMYFEGNAFQGESSVLASVLPDGTARRPVVTGAQR